LSVEALLGVRFLSTEYSTGKTHAGRIDTLGFDENNCPVILEYKRSTGENVINQGLFYLDWLMDHQAEFKLKVLEKFGAEAADTIDWSSPRLICIAADFTRYDEHAVQQINRNIELIRYRQFGAELLLLELVNSVSGKPKTFIKPSQKTTGKAELSYGAAALTAATSELRELFASLETYVLSLGDDVQRKDLKVYTAFKRIRNFVTIEFYKDRLLLHVSLNPDDVELLEGFTRDVRNVGHWGTGDLEVWVRNNFDLERAKPLIKQAFDGGAATIEGQWTEEAVLETVGEKRGAEEADAAKRLIEWSKRNASGINWGKGSNDGSFCPVFDLGTGYPFIPFRLYTYGSIEILFNRMSVRQSAPFNATEKRIELLRSLNEIPGIGLPVDGINRRPAVSLSALVNPDSLSTFLRIIEMTVREVKAAVSP
jgi:predicted transport protein